MGYQFLPRRWREGRPVSSRPSRSVWTIAYTAFVVQALSCGFAEAQTASDSTPDKDIVVVGQRSQSPVAGAKPEDSISPATIRGLGADSIGDVLARLHARYGDEDFSVLVNGRRVGALEAVNALPPEALAKIDILPASSAGNLGLPTGERVLNIQLRPKFETATLEGTGTATTEGGGGSQSIATRYAHIHESDRFNLAVTYRRAEGLHQSDRREGRGEQGLDARQTTSGDLTLIPRGNALTATVGKAGTLGSANFDLSLDGGLSRSQFLSNLNNQRTQGEYIRAGVSLNGPLGRYSWTVATNAGTARADTSSRLVAAPVQAGSAFRTVSTTNNVNFSGDVSGPLITLPSGVITLTSGVSSAFVRVTAKSVVPVSLPSDSSYISLTLRENAQLPIAKDGSILGRLLANIGAEYTSVRGIGSNVSHQYGAEWSPVSFLTLSLSRNVQPALPSPTQLFSPTINQDATPFYDDASGTTVPITVITGGASQLRGVSTKNDTVRMSASLGRANMSASYDALRTDHPIFSFLSPSALLQSVKPDLFTRTTNGALVSYDSRPFQGVSETAERVSWNLHISGIVKHGSVAASSQAGPDGIGWDLGVNHDIILNDRVILGTQSKAINVIETPLSLGAASASRHRVTTQTSVSGARFGASLFVSWKSGARGASVNNDGPATKINPLTQVNGEAFCDLGGRNTQLDNPSRVRVKLSVDNLFNSRPRLTEGDDGNAYGLLSDPLGRTLTLNIRKVF